MTKSFTIYCETERNIYHFLKTPGLNLGVPVDEEIVTLAVLTLGDVIRVVEIE